MSLPKTITIPTKTFNDVVAVLLWKQSMPQCAKDSSSFDNGFYRLVDRQIEMEICDKIAECYVSHVSIQIPMRFNLQRYVVIDEDNIRLFASVCQTVDIFPEHDQFVDIELIAG